jgi:hypothetical protein
MRTDESSLSDISCYQGNGIFIMFMNACHLTLYWAISNQLPPSQIQFNIFLHLLMVLPRDVYLWGFTTKIHTRAAFSAHLLFV